MIAVRTRTLRFLPRQARRVFKMTWPSRKDAVRERTARPGMLKSFERMLDSHVQLMFRNIER